MNNSLSAKQDYEANNLSEHELMNTYGGNIGWDTLLRAIINSIWDKGDGSFYC